MEGLFKRLMQYSQDGRIPMHMPGHKRNFDGFSAPSPYKLDITEIEGFDDYHHPEEILKESMEYAAGVYGTKKTYYLVNGSTCGILTALSCVAGTGDKILVARNCHKSVSHGVELLNLTPVYIYPETIPDLWIHGVISPEDVEKALEENPDVCGLIMTSPTYEGVVSDIERIAELLHQKDKVLIVDEAHGAHFPFSEELPKSAISCGADLVIQSLHKTLPSYTQTAVLHCLSNRIAEWKLQKYLGMFQTSSPSYIFMAGMERCIEYMSGEGQSRIKEYFIQLSRMRERLEGCDGIQLLGYREEMFDYDPSKIVLWVEGWTGIEIAECLRQEYHIEPEMVADDYVILMTSLCDDFKWYELIVSAAKAMGARRKQAEALPQKTFLGLSDYKAKLRYTPAQVAGMERECVLLEESLGRVSGQTIYLYPPGIPIIMPGEEITRECLQAIFGHQNNGLSVKGLEGQNREVIQCIK